jgi:hypothetical protein
MISANRKITQATLTETASKRKRLPLIDTGQATIILGGICGGFLTHHDDVECFSCDKQIAMKNWVIIA